MTTDDIDALILEQQHRIETQGTRNKVTYVIAGIIGLLIGFSAAHYLF